MVGYVLFDAVAVALAGGVYYGDLVGFVDGDGLGLGVTGFSYFGTFGEFLAYVDVFFGELFDSTAGEGFVDHYLFGF